MSVDVGTTLKLEVEVEGCPEPRIKWYKDGKEVTTDARIKIERDTKRLDDFNLGTGKISDGEPCENFKETCHNCCLYHKRNVC